MSTLSGFGTMYFGWRHDEESGLGEATQWVVALFMPVWPLARHELRLLADPDDEPAVSWAGLLSIGGAAALGDQVEVVRELPVDSRSVVRTLLRAYVGLPLLLGVPLVAALGLVMLLDGWLGDSAGAFEMTLIALPMLIYAGYFFAVIATLFHRSRGGRK